MIEPELKAEIEVLNAKIDATYISAEKTRKYFLWTMVITIGVIALPLIALPFIVQSVFSAYSAALGF